MRTPHLLRAASNVRKLKENLIHLLDDAALAAIGSEISANIVQLYALGRNHYRFAVRQNNRSWRQKISRLYYGAYNTSRAIRLAVNGDYSTDSSDHKKIETLPDDFPRKSIYSNRLGVLRDDRNLCDYDHTVRIGDLLIGVDEAVELVQQFMTDAQVYLSNRGVDV
jgi:hypothetical protein